MIATSRAPGSTCRASARRGRGPRRQTTSEWAAENRVLGDKDSAEPGPWSNARAPYLAGIMNALGDPEITDVVIMKAAQVGLSEAVRNAVGYWIDQDPGPLLWVMPDESSAKEILSEKLAPLIRSTPRLASHLSDRAHDVGKRKILLDNMEIHAAWAGSPQSLASRPKRRVVYDEADKYPTWSGKESDPIALGNKRTTTFGHRAKRAILGTPTTRLGPIWRAWDESPVKLRFHVPCPRCGEYSALAWSQIRWPSDLPGTRTEQGQAIEDRSLAWYECPRCTVRVEERERAMMLARGVWAADGHETVDRAGKLIGKRPASRRVAFQVPATISPWVSWSMMAGEFVSAIGDESRMMDWRNSRLGEPYEVRAAAVKGDAFDEKIRAGNKPGVVPRWAGMLLATADTQKDHFWFVIRAWGHGFRSRLIDYGRVETFAELRERCLETRYRSEDVAFSPLAAHMLCIDSGGGGDVGADQSRTHQVYQFALTDPARIYAVKGFGGHRELEVPVRQAFVAYAPPGRPGADARRALPPEDRLLQGRPREAHRPARHRARWLGAQRRRRRRLHAADVVGAQGAHAAGPAAGGALGADQRRRGESPVGLRVHADRRVADRARRDAAARGAARAQPARGGAGRRRSRAGSVGLRGRGTLMPGGDGWDSAADWSERRRPHAAARAADADAGRTPQRRGRMLPELQVGDGRAHASPAGGRDGLLALPRLREHVEGAGRGRHRAHCAAPVASKTVPIVSVV
jgi:phage terminase large subunit GpA-like protein